MLKILQDLLDSLLPPTPGSDPQSAEHALQLATAVMLVEVMRADISFHPGEREAVLAALRDKFALSADEAMRLAALAEATAQQATDLFAFTSRINERFEMPQKLRMVEHMWRVAYADGHLSEHERHVLWRVADLLHVPQGAYVHARLRTQQQAAAVSASSVAASTAQPCAGPIVHSVAVLTAPQAVANAHNSRSSQSVTRPAAPAHSKMPSVTIVVGSGARPKYSPCSQGRPKAGASSGWPSRAQPFRPVVGAAIPRQLG